jgi:hypothetical protein
MLRPQLDMEGSKIEPMPNKKSPKLAAKPKQSTSVRRKFYSVEAC